ncbi:MAG: flagellar basal-body rod protein FlgG [Bacteriovoracaceae bacterium]|jgi:flagellar basal-body rod protein FlgG
MKLLSSKLILLSLLVYSPLSSAMLKALNTAATGMAAQESNVNTISNNIANINTVGFKKRRTEMESLLYETVNDPGARSSNNTVYNVGMQVGSGVKVSAIRKEFTDGSPNLTNNPFDLMVKGDGFFGVILPNQQVVYTRDGSFNVDKTGTLVTKQGYKVMPGLVFPPGTMSVNITEEGLVEAFLKNQIEPAQVGTIPVYTFVNPVGLSSAGQNFYKVTRSSGPASENVAGQNKTGVILQGALETSNVSIMTEMTDLIKAQRAYEMNSKVMGVADQMLQAVNNLR